MQLGELSADGLEGGKKLGGIVGDKAVRGLAGAAAEQRFDLGIRHVEQDSVDCLLNLLSMLLFWREGDVRWTQLPRLRSSG